MGRADTRGAAHEYEPTRECALATIRDELAEGVVWLSSARSCSLRWQQRPSWVLFQSALVKPFLSIGDAVVELRLH
jgi:hypothetical protein